MPASRQRRACWALLLALAIAPTAAAEEARELLARMAQTMRAGAYEGTFVYQRAGSIQTMSLVHAVVDGVEHERLRTLSGEPFEIIRAGTELTCVWPRASEALVARRPEALLPSRPLAELTELPPMYSAEVTGRERVAGRDAHVIVVRPRDRLRYGYRMWLDREHHLLLRSDLIGLDGAALERTVFTRMEKADTIAAERFDPAIDQGDFADHYTTERIDGVTRSPQWVPAELPAGFEAISHRDINIPGAGAVVQHSVYSDGLASVSVFVEPVDAEIGMLQGLTYLGAVHAFGRRVDGRQVTVVGELPAATVRTIAESVRPREPG